MLAPTVLFHLGFISFVFYHIASFLSADGKSDVMLKIYVIMHKIIYNSDWSYSLIKVASNQKLTQAEMEGFSLMFAEKNQRLQIKFLKQI